MRLCFVEGVRGVFLREPRAVAGGLISTQPLLYMPMTAILHQKQAIKGSGRSRGKCTQRLEQPIEKLCSPSVVVWAYSVSSRRAEILPQRKSCPCSGWLARLYT